MYKPDFEIEKPPRKMITLDASDFWVIIVCVFLAGALFMGLALGL